MQSGKAVQIKCCKTTENCPNNVICGLFSAKNIDYLHKWLYHLSDFDGASVSKPPTPTLSNHNPEEAASGLIKLLSSSSRTIRKGTIPDNDSLKNIAVSLVPFIKASAPIPFSIAWGCAKTPVLGVDSIDLAELLALEQLIYLNLRIREYYQPGAVFNIFLADEWFRYMYGASQDKQIDCYCTHFKEIASSLNDGLFRVFRLSDILTDMSGVPSLLEKNFQKLANYWEDSRNIPEQEWTSLASLKALEMEGFHGVIPNVMREFFLAKVVRYVSEPSERACEEAVQRFFAFSLMQRQLNIFQRNKVAVDLSYVLPPPGTPSSLYHNRLFIRPFPLRITKKTIAPWTCKTILAWHQKSDTFKIKFLTGPEQDGDLANVHCKIDITIPLQEHCLELENDYMSACE